MKKVFIISSILLVLVLGFLGIYNFAFKNNSANPVADAGKKEELQKRDANVPVAPLGGAEVFLSEPTLGATTDGESAFFYSLRDNAFKKISLGGGNATALSGSLSGKPARIVWSPSREKALALVNETTGPRWYLVDFSSKNVSPLKAGIDRINWTNVGDSILYEFTDPLTQKNTLNLANPDGSNWKRLADLGEGVYFIAPVPRSSEISYWKRPNGLETNTLTVVALTGDSQKAIFSDRYGADYLWAKDGNHLLIGSVAEKGGSLLSLGVANSQGGEYQDLLVPTFVNKVVWSDDNQTLFYALPGSFPAGSILPNDYSGKPIYTKDTFWKMDITTGKKDRLVSLEDMQAGLDATNLFLSKDESSLFFTDRATGKVYRIKL